MPSRFLTQALGQAGHIHELIKQSAEELCSVNTDIQHELANGNLIPGIKNAFDTNTAVIRKLLAAAEEQAAVNQTLQNEIRDRTMVEYQLNAAVEQEDGFRNAALHDPLTGLPNRVLFKDRLQHGIAQATRHRWILAVMFVDLDNFKTHQRYVWASARRCCSADRCNAAQAQYAQRRHSQSLWR